MKKREFAKAVAARVEGLTIGDAEVIIDAVGESIVEALMEGDSVKIPGFATFSTVVVPERVGTHNFGDQKGEQWVKPAHKRVKTTVTRSVKSAIE